ncbi:MAG: hypothetical protein QXI37_00560 [Thermoprotei archaeon]
MMLVGGVLYSILFMYFQQTLLIDNLSYTSAGPFSLHLPPGVNVVFSTVPPVPESAMPFPLWGPFFSVTTNYFDLAFTPLSIALTVATAFLLMFVVSGYIDIYRAVKSKLSDGRTASFTQTLTVVGTVLSCSCEFFEGLLAAIEPAAAILVVVGTLLAALDEMFLLAALAILALSSVMITMKAVGADPFRSNKTGLVWIILLLIPFTVYLAASGGSLTALALIGALTLTGLVYSLLTDDYRLVALAVPAAGYYASVALSHMASATYVNTVAIPVAIVLGFIISVGKPLTKQSAAFQLIVAAAMFALRSPAWTGYAAGLAASALTHGLHPKPRQLVTLQTVAWIPVMLGPLAVAYRPTPLLPIVPLKTQLELYLLMWLVATPATWYVGLRALFQIMDLHKIAVSETLQMEEAAVRRARITVPVLPITFVASGVAAIASQYILFWTDPTLFLVNSVSQQAERVAFVASTSSLLLISAGTLALCYGLYGVVTNGKGPVSLGLRRLLSDKSGIRVFWSVLWLYLFFSLMAVGVIALGGTVPPGVPLPSVAVFTAGAPPLFVPSVTLYIMRGLGLVLVPEHIYVAAMTAFLVALAFKGMFLLRSSAKTKGAGILASVPAIALACPTCTVTSITTILAIGSADTGAALGILADPSFDYVVLAASWLVLALSVVYVSRIIGRRFSVGA